MLLQFNFKNFMSFKDEASLDMTAAKISENNDSVFSLGGEKVLPLAAIYGANASGKSNVIKAFSFMQYYVLNSFGFGGEEQGNDVNYAIAMPFQFDDCSLNNDALFEVYFSLAEDSSEKVYNYGFCINSKIEISEEWLNVRAKTASESKKIFYRKNNDIEFQDRDIQAGNIVSALESQTLILSLGAKLKVEKLKTIREWFSCCNVLDFSDISESIQRQKRAPRGFRHKIVQDSVQKFLSGFDNSIKGFNIYEASDNSKTAIKISTQHQSKNGEIIEFPLELESAGTLKMFSIYDDLKNALEGGSVLFVDELNAHLHPLLSRNILLMFADKKINKKGAQLIFTTHDAWQLSDSILRRDEIWFTEKDDSGVSSLYSLADFKGEQDQKIRKDENYLKNYLIGKYGAIPKLSVLDLFPED